MARARATLRAKAGKTKKRHVCDSYSLYVSIIRDPGASLREKMDAQTRIDVLLGLAAPQQHRHAGVAGAPPVRQAGVIILPAKVPLEVPPPEEGPCPAP